jgi:hypothetical protein
VAHNQWCETEARRADGTLIEKYENREEKGWTEGKVFFKQFYYWLNNLIRTGRIVGWDTHKKPKNQKNKNSQLLFLLVILGVWACGSDFSGGVLNQKPP